jgi:hypothetical protein
MYDIIFDLIYHRFICNMTLIINYQCFTTFHRIFYYFNIRIPTWEALIYYSPMIYAQDIITRATTQQFFRFVCLTLLSTKIDRKTIRFFHSFIKCFQLYRLKRLLIYIHITIWNNTSVNNLFFWFALLTEE